jgi:hypothetical protein
MVVNRIQNILASSLMTPVSDGGYFLMDKKFRWGVDFAALTNNG